MLKVTGFPTKQAAEEYKAMCGGKIIFDKKKDGKPYGVGMDYYYAVAYGLINKKQCPYAVVIKVSGM